MIAGAALGAGAWLALHAPLSLLPIWIRFLLGWLLFTLGPGIAVGSRLTRDLDPLRRVIVLLGIGSAAAPVLIHTLGRLNLVSVFPYVAAALVGAGLAIRDHGEEKLSRSDVLACAGLVSLTVILGVVAFGHRLETNSAGVFVYGDYDTADLGYYAAEASEASHTVPPLASYYSGHRLNAAYYPHLVLGMINRFMAVPVLSMYYRYAWPTFLTLSSLTAFVVVSSIASRATAVLAVILILVGGDFSYLAAWFLPHNTYQWDYLLWPTNFLSPTMEVQHFATWGPSLPLIFTTLYAAVRGFQTRAYGWTVLSALLMAVLFEFKPFAFIVLIAGACAATVFAHGDWAVRRRLAWMIGLSILFSLPFLIAAATIDPSDRRSRLVIDPFLLPKRMLIKTDLTEAFMSAVNRVAPWPSVRTWMFLLMASVVFLVGGVGVRWLAAPRVWKALRRKGDGDAAAWRLLAWGSIAGVVIPFVVATDPYVDTLQFHLTGLYLAWIFVAVALADLARARPKTGRLVIAAVIAAALPSSLHYLGRKWTDTDRPPKASLTRAELTIAEQLRQYDPETTVVLHDRPLAPSLTTIVAARRIVLGWDVRYSAVGGEDRLRDVNAFYTSVDRNPDEALEILRRYKVTHVIVRTPADRVHPSVIARLNAVLQFPEVALYAVPLLTGP
ncbi:MAG: hypothetical protein C5B57_13155 [Blastocatellia bacterium]|nr:MAG: hypothetical protein C5B57_13155 [Blastocatellia bacterium]